MKEKHFLMSVFLFLLPLWAHAQVTLSGRVVTEGGKPLPGVNIRVDNSLTGGTTDGKGTFTIAGLSDGRHVLNFTCVGYEPQKYKTDGNDKNIRVFLCESHNRLEQVVVTGTGTHHRMADSPVPVTVITRQDIMSSNVSGLDEALTRLAPGISTFTNGMGTTMSLNGMNESYLLVLENGRRLSGDNRYDRINVANIKRIEILNGAASALYGSDAIGGVVNVITDESKNTADVSSYTRYTTHGRLTENVNADVNLGRFSSYTSYQRRQADSWQNNGMDENGHPTGKPTSTGFYRNNVNQCFEFRATDKLNFSVFGNWFNNQTRRPKDAKYYSGGKERAAYTYDVRHESYDYGAGMKYIITSRAYLEAGFHADNSQSSYRYFAKSGKYVPGDDITRKKTHYYNASLKGIFALGDHHKLSAGVEYVNDQLKSELDNIRFENMYTLSFFAQDEVRLAERLQAVLGLRYIYNENFQNHATPNVALMYRWGHMNLRASYAAGFRTPTLSQLYATDVAKTSNRYTIGNMNLKPEKSDFYSLNAEYVGRRLSVSVTGFINDVRDMINYRTLSKDELAGMGMADAILAYDEVRQRDNVDHAKTKGISVNFHWNLGMGFSAGGGYSFMDTKARQRQADGSYKTSPIDKSIRHMGNITGEWKHTWGNYGLNVSMQGHLQGRRYSQTYGYAPKFQQWDLNTRHSFNLRTVLLEPGIGIENLFNDIDRRPWNNNFSTLNPGRSVYASLLVRFKS